MKYTELMSRFIASNHGDIEVPENEAEKIELSRDLFGSMLINNIDYWLDRALNYIENDKPEEPFPRDNAASHTDKLYRDTFAKLDVESKEIIFKLIVSTVGGAIYSTLLGIDRFDFGELKILYKPKSQNQTEDIDITSKAEEELHVDFFNWTGKFSKYKETL